MTPKQMAKKLLRPFVGPVLRRVEARIDGRIRTQLAAMEAAGELFRAQVDGLNRAIPALLGGISAQGAAERHFARTIDELTRRIEFVRKELLFELRYPDARREAPTAEVEPRVLDAAKLERMRGEIRLNLGAGHVSRPEYLNVDTRELDGIDVLADVRDLPFEKESVAEIYSAHVLEHFPIEELRKVLVPYWVSLLQPSGRFVAVVPDMETMISEYSAGRLEFEELREVTYGGQEYEGDFHFNGFSQASIADLLEGAGLADVQLRASARRNGLCYEMEIVGIKPGNVTSHGSEAVEAPTGA
jgi:hypothetical protein